MKTTMYSFRLPIELRDTLLALQAKHGFNSQSEVIIQALACFADMPVVQRQTTDSRIDALQSELQAQINALNDRVGAIENAGATQVLPTTPANTTPPDKVQRRQAAAKYASQLITEGYDTPTAIAKRFNADGLPTLTGQGEWCYLNVSRLLKREGIKLKGEQLDDNSTELS